MVQRQRSLAWQFGMSAYWFATSMKWFLLLIAILPNQVQELVPGGEKGTLWGRVVMLGALWALIGPSLFGWLSDRMPTAYGRWRPWLLLGSATTVGALLLLANPKQYPIIVIGYLVLQVGDDLAQGPYSALVPALVPPEQRGVASGVMGFLQLSAQVVGAIVAQRLGDVVLIYYFLAATNVVCAVITLATVREDPKPPPLDASPFFKAWIEPWKSADFRWVWFTRFLNALGFYLVSTYLLFFLTDVVREFTLFGITLVDANMDDYESIHSAARTAVFIIALEISCVAAIGALAFGKLADRIGRKSVAAATGILMALVLIPVLLLPSFTVLALLAFPFALAYGGYQSADWALASDVMPESDSLAKNMGLWQSSIAAPQIVSGLSGAIVDWANSIRHGLGYQLTFLLAAFAFLLGSVLIKRIRGSK